LVGLVADRGAQVSWLVESSKGPKSIRKLLEQAGWRLDLTRSGKITRLTGVLDRAYEIPQPSAFRTDLGSKTVELFADYGVFSPGRIDDGTALLLDIALGERPVETVADIGVGYGPLAIGLVMNGIATRAVATDVDSVALWLAEQNAGRHSVRLDLALTDNPIEAESTALTVCNIPTHISSDGTRLLTDSLGMRAASGRVLAVVHSTLTDRYTRYFAALGRAVAATPGPQHTVLTVTAGRTSAHHG
jgi:16S rRNA G1207 methylase RsmC